MNVQGDYSIDAKSANDFFFLIYENKTFNNKILGEKKITVIWKDNHNFLLIRTDFL